MGGRGLFAQLSLALYLFACLEYLFRCQTDYLLFDWIVFFGQGEQLLGFSFSYTGRFCFSFFILFTDEAQGASNLKLTRWN